MCGIVAIFNVKEQTPELRTKALGMSKKIRPAVLTGAAFLGRTRQQRYQRHH